MALKLKQNYQGQSSLFLLCYLLSCSPPFESDTSERNKNKAPIVPIRDIGNSSSSSENSKIYLRLKGKWGWLENKALKSATDPAKMSAFNSFSQACTGFFDESLRLVTTNTCPDSCTDLSIKIWMSDELISETLCTDTQEVISPKGEKLRRYIIDLSPQELSTLKSLSLSSAARASKNTDIRALELNMQPTSPATTPQKFLVLSEKCETFGPLEATSLGSHSCTKNLKDSTHLFYAASENAWMGISLPSKESGSSNTLIVSQDLKEL